MPDLNSVPASPRNPTPTAPTTTSTTSQTQTPSHHSSRNPSTTTSRRTSQIFPMSPPPLPLASPSGTIPTQQTGSHAFPPLSPGMRGGTGETQSGDNMAGVPMRHPRPLTAAELHLELEKEQEAVVNRLTRELSALRAHSASVASTTSLSSTGTSAVMLDTDHHPGATHPVPTASRRHRSSSSVSRGSVSTPYMGPTSFPGGPAVPARGWSVSSQNQAQGQGGGGEAMERGLSGAGQGGGGRPSASRQPSVTTPRYEEVAHYRAELEEAKRENEGLRRRIRELEREISGRGVERGRSVNGVDGHAGGETNSTAPGAES